MYHTFLSSRHRYGILYQQKNREGSEESEIGLGIKEYGIRE